MGDMSGSCQTLTLSGPIEKIRASYARSEAKVSAIKYYKGSAAKTYGTLLSTFKEWTFSDTNILLGLHGRVIDEGKLSIKELGFVTLDTSLSSCPTPEPEATTETTTTTPTETTETTETPTETTTTEPTETPTETTTTEPGESETTTTEPTTTETPTNSTETTDENDKTSSKTPEGTVTDGSGKLESVDEEEKPKNMLVIYILIGLATIVVIETACIICACMIKRKKKDGINKVVMQGITKYS